MEPEQPDEQQMVKITYLLILSWAATFHIEFICRLFFNESINHQFIHGSSQNNDKSFSEPNFSFLNWILFNLISQGQEHINPWQYDVIHKHLWTKDIKHRGKAGVKSTWLRQTWSQTMSCFKVLLKLCLDSFADFTPHSLLEVLATDD